jgi:hypothetical protein
MYILIFLLLFNVVIASKQQPKYELIEGDVRLLPIQSKKIYKHNLRGRGLGTIGDEEIVGLWRFHWTGDHFQIPVVFDEDDEFEGNNTMSQSVADSIWLKMKQMEDKLDNVIEFIKEFDKADHLDGYIRIGSYTSGCWSYVGRLPTIYQPQVVNLATFCDFTDVVEHEMMHALGFFHEQARPDRDDYVDIHWSNIPGDKVSNFEIADGIDSRDSPYDRRSVMHYDNYAFAINEQLPTMSSTDNNAPLLGSSFTMTNTDMIQIRMLYRCLSGPVASYNTNCVSGCPCRINEGKCLSDAGCEGSLVCDGTSLQCTEPSPTTAPTTGTPTTVGATSSPSASPTSSAPTPNPTPNPTTLVTTSAPTNEPSKSNLNVGLIIGLTTMGVGILIGTIFF